MAACLIKQVVVMQGNRSGDLRLKEVSFFPVSTAGQTGKKWNESPHRVANLLKVGNPWQRV